MRYGNIHWSTLEKHFSAPTLSDAFNDFVINIIPISKSFSQNEKFATRPFLIPTSRGTTSALKVFIALTENTSRINLLIGQDERSHAENYLYPEFMRILEGLIGRPEVSIQQILKY
jgi:hypothetical protein